MAAKTNGARRRAVLAAAVACVLAVLLSLSGCAFMLSSNKTPSLPAAGSARVTYLDVGAADAMCIQTSDGGVMVIDTGDTDTKDQVVSDLKNLGVTKIDILVLTHAHADHIGGAQAIIAAFPIGQAFISPQATTTKVYTNTLKALDQKGVPTSVPTPGQAITLGDCTFTCLAPSGTHYDEINNSSVVLRMTHGDDAFLFSGDAQSQEEKEIMDSGADMTCDVLKVAHHGSSTSTSKDWLAACGSRLKTVVISVGKNDNGLPTDKTLKRLAGYTLYRTDKNGAVTATSTGQGIQFTTEK